MTEEQLKDAEGKWFWVSFGCNPHKAQFLSHTCSTTQKIMRVRRVGVRHIPASSILSETTDPRRAMKVVKLFKKLFLKP